MSAPTHCVKRAHKMKIQNQHKDPKDNAKKINPIIYTLRHTMQAHHPSSKSKSRYYSPVSMGKYMTLPNLQIFILAVLTLYDRYTTEMVHCHFFIHIVETKMPRYCSKHTNARTQIQSRKQNKVFQKWPGSIKEWWSCIISMMAEHSS